MKNQFWNRLTEKNKVSVNNTIAYNKKPSYSPQNEKEEESGEKNAFFSRYLSKLVTISLSMVFFGLPLFFLSVTYQGLFFEKQIYFYFWVLLAVAAWVLKGIIEGKLKLKRTVLDIPLILLIIFYFLSAVFSLDRWHSFWGGFRDPSRGFFVALTLILFYYVLASTLNKRRLKFYVSSIVFSGFLVTLISSLNILGISFLPQKLAQYIPLSLTGTISGLTTYIASVLLITISFVLFINKDDKNVKKKKTNLVKQIINIILILSVILDLFLLLALYGFVNWLAVVISIGLFLIFILSLLVKTPSKWTWLPVFGFIAILISLMIGPNNIARISLPVEYNPTNKLSFDISKKFLKNHNGIKELFLGVGPANYGYVYSRSLGDDYNNANKGMLYTARYYKATGIINEALATTGILGIILVLLLILDWLGTELYFLFKGKTRDKILSLGLFSGALVIIINAFNFQTTGTLALYGVVIASLALTALFLENKIESGKVDLSLKTSPQYALVLAFIFTVVTAGIVYLLVFVGKVVVADARLGLAMKDKNIKLEDLIKKTQDSIRLYNREGEYYALLSQELLALANQEIVDKGDKVDQGTLLRYFDGAIQFAKQAKKLIPKDVFITETLAQAYEAARFSMKDALDLAEKTYNEAKELEPHNPDFYLKLGQIKLVQANQEKDEQKKKEIVKQAEDLFQQAIKKKKDYHPGYYYLSAAEESIKNYDDAIKNMQMAFNLQPNNINYLFNLGRLYQLRGKDEDLKKAEQIFKSITGVKDKAVNVHLSLGLIYEKTNRKKEAIDELKKVMDLLPENNKPFKERIQKWIDGINAGRSIEEVEKELAKQEAEKNKPQNTQNTQKKENETNVQNQSNQSNQSNKLKNQTSETPNQPSPAANEEKKQLPVHP